MALIQLLNLDPLRAARCVDMLFRELFIAACCNCLLDDCHGYKLTSFHKLT